MNTPLISIIVPIYNTEHYLHHCIDSILEQTYTNFELLLIDDGSTDKSGMICDEYAEKDKRIRVFHKKNGGLSSARNLGIKNIRGSYAIFVDSDDYWLEFNSLSTLLNVANKNQCDIVRGEYHYVDETERYLFNDIDESKEKYAGLVLKSGDFIEKIICGKWMVCMSLFKSDVLQYFNESQKFQEDIEYNVRIFAKSLKCVYVPFVFYAYRLRSNSLVHSISSVNLKSSFDLCGIFEEYSKKCEDIKTSSLYKYYSIMMYYWNLCSLVNSFYFHKTQLIEEFNLRQVQNKVSVLAKYNVFKYPLVIYLNPEIACLLVRQYLQLKKYVRKLLRIF